MKLYTFLVAYMSLITTLITKTAIPINPVDGMPPGVTDNLKYFYKIRAGSFSDIKKMILIR